MSDLMLSAPCSSGGRSQKEDAPMGGKAMISLGVSSLFSLDWSELLLLLLLFVAAAREVALFDVARKFP